VIGYHRRMVAWQLTGRESMLGILARWLRQRRREAGAFLAVALRFVLVVAALGLITLSAYGVAWQLGALVGGLSLLLLEWIVKRR
jgi:hypothetical protein